MIQQLAQNASIKKASLTKIINVLLALLSIKNAKPATEKICALLALIKESMFSRVPVLNVHYLMKTV
jgi:hypothetical protein